VKFENILCKTHVLYMNSLSGALRDVRGMMITELMLFNDNSRTQNSCPLLER